MYTFNKSTETNLLVYNESFNLKAHRTNADVDKCPFLTGCHHGLTKIFHALMHAIEKEANYNFCLLAYKQYTVHMVCIVHLLPSH